MCQSQMFKLYGKSKTKQNMDHYFESLKKGFSYTKVLQKGKLKARANCIVSIGFELISDLTDRGFSPYMGINIHE